MAALSKYFYGLHQRIGDGIRGDPYIISRETRADSAGGVKGGGFVSHMRECDTHTMLFDEMFGKDCLACFQFVNSLIFSLTFFLLSSDGFFLYTIWRPYSCGYTYGKVKYKLGKEKNICICLMLYLNVQSRMFQ